MTIALLAKPPLAVQVRRALNGLDFAWHDPSDLSTMFQDHTGTTPVTGVEQPVGKILDKSGNGYHATQSITASRPTLSARYNLLLNSSTLSTQNVTTVAAQHTLSFTGTGTVTLSGTATGSLVGTGVSDRVSLTFTPTAGTLTLTVTGSVTQAMLNIGASAMPYQAITTATSYDSNPLLFPWYLKYDGVDDYMNLPYMGLYASGAASAVIALSAPVQSANNYPITEATTVEGASVYIPLRRIGTLTTVDTLIRNSSSVVALDSAGATMFSGSAANVGSFVDTGTSFKKYNNSLLSENNSYARSGAVAVANTTIGALVQATLTGFVNMDYYGSIIVKGAALTDKQRKLCEQYLARKAGVTLA